MTPAEKLLHDWALAQNKFVTILMASDALNITKDNASQRIRSLVKQGAMLRKETPPSSAGREPWLYKSVKVASPKTRGNFSECDALIRYAQFGRVAT